MIKKGINNNYFLVNKIKIKKKFKYSKNDCLIIFLYIIGSIFYFFSLKRINGTKMECFSRIGLNCYYFLGKLLLISSIFINISLYLIIFKNYSKIHLFIILLIFSILFRKDHNDGIARHGLYNIIVFVFILIVLIFISIYIHYLHLFFKKNIILLIIYIIPIPLLFIIFNLYKLNHFSCLDWDKGLNNTIIDNSYKDYPCIINISKPHSCYLNEIGPYIDLTSFYRPTCLNKKILEYEKNILLKNFKMLKYSNESNMNIFGLPLTNNKKYHPKFYGTLLYKGKRDFFTDINNNIILMDLYNKNKSKFYPNIERPEIEIFMNNKTEDMKILINIHKNETLIKKKTKIIKKKKLLYKNIMIFFFDTLSRAHFHRIFKKTKNFLNKFSKYENQYNRKEFTIFEYFKYHSLHGYSDPNLKAIYYGSSKNKKGVNFAEYFSKNGFIIGRSNTYCGKESLFNRRRIFKHAFWDHENLSLACLNVFYNSIFIRKLNSLITKCLFGKQLFEYSLEYLESFWNAYKSQNKIFLLQSLEGHEPSNQVIGHLDDSLFNFLNKLYSIGLFKDTSIILFSDHGEHLNWPLYLTSSYDYLYERTLPILLLIIPNSNLLYKNNLYEIMKNNEQIFITPFDIHDTLIHLAFGKNKIMYKKFKTSYGQSLFKKLNYKTRYCQSPLYNNNIKLCHCKKNK